MALSSKWSGRCPFKAVIRNHTPLGLQHRLDIPDKIIWPYRLNGADAALSRQ